MPVIWTGKGEAMDTVGLAVPCHLCDAKAGQPCSTRTFPLHRGYQTHMQRQDMAEAFGFVLVGADAAPAKQPAQPRPAPAPDLFGARP